MDNFKIRDLEPEKDGKALSNLLSIWRRNNTTEEDALESIRTWPSHLFVHHMVGELDGSVVVYGRCAQLGPTQSYAVDVVVEPEFRRRGLGTKMIAQCFEVIKDKPGIKPVSFVHDGDAESLSFATKNGFAPFAEHFESALDVQEFDESPYIPLYEKLEAEGIELKCLTADMSDELKRRFGDCYIECDGQTPDQEELGVMDWESMEGYVFGASWFRPEGAWYATQGDEIVGLSMTGPKSNPFDGKMMTDFTGVRRPWHRKGIATALKAKVAVFCRDFGATKLETFNSSVNESMLAVNHKLGFQRTSGRIMLRKDTTI